MLRNLNLVGPHLPEDLMQIKVGDIFGVLKVIEAPIRGYLDIIYVKVQCLKCNRVFYMFAEDLSEYDYKCPLCDKKINGKDQSEQVYGYLLAVYRTYTVAQRWNYLSFCKRCGSFCNILGKSLRSGNSSTCGCSLLRYSGLSNYTGLVYGWCVVLKAINDRNIDDRSGILCRCRCGTEFTSTSGRLITKGVSSCGCFRKYNSFLSKYKFGLRFTRIYALAVGAFSRCKNPNHICWNSYGYLDIQFKFDTIEDFCLYCIENLNYSENIDNISIDRISSWGDYCIGNLRLIDDTLQNYNKKSNYIHYIRLEREGILSFYNNCISKTYLLDYFSFIFEKHIDGISQLDLLFRRHGIEFDTLDFEKLNHLRYYFRYFWVVNVLLIQLYAYQYFSEQDSSLVVTCSIISRAIENIIESYHISKEDLQSNTYEAYVNYFNSNRHKIILGDFQKFQDKFLNLFISKNFIIELPEPQDNKTYNYNLIKITYIRSYEQALKISVHCYNIVRAYMEELFGNKEQHKLYYEAIIGDHPEFKQSFQQLTSYIEIVFDILVKRFIVDYCNYCLDPAIHGNLNVFDNVPTDNILKQHSIEVETLLNKHSELISFIDSFPAQRLYEQANIYFSTRNFTEPEKPWKHVPWRGPHLIILSLNNVLWCYRTAPNFNFLHGFLHKYLEEINYRKTVEDYYQISMQDIFNDKAMAIQRVLLNVFRFLILNTILHTFTYCMRTHPTMFERYRAGFTATQIYFFFPDLIERTKAELTKKFPDQPELFNDFEKLQITISYERFLEAAKHPRDYGAITDKLYFEWKEEPIPEELLEIVEPSLEE